MNMEEARVNSVPEQVPVAPASYLTSRDIDRLTNYKWRYSLEAHGFSSAQATRLLFMKWLYAHGSVHS